MFKSFRRFITFIGILFLLGCMTIGVTLFSLVKYYGKDLPDYTQLANYDPPTVTRFYDRNGQLMAEYAKEKRLYVPITAIPKRLRYAFIAAEDQNFYSHPGIDIFSVSRAAVQNLANYSQHKSLVGGSTITQQVVKNFLLTKERTLSRKVKEAILSMRISRAYSKDRILELYLNEIYLGAGSYGVAAAALNYFNKSMDELTIEEAALLASMPKAPTQMNPRKYYDRAKARRDWVIERMQEEGYITAKDAKHAIATPIILRSRDNTEITAASSFSEAARRSLADMFGDDVLYERGLTVRTTLDPKLQRIALKSLQFGLESYDRRHGYRGPVAHRDIKGDWQQELAAVTPPEDMLAPRVLGIVLVAGAKQVEVGLAGGKTVFIPAAEFAWARNWKKGKPFTVGDIVIVEPINVEKRLYALRQIPKVNGAMVVLNPHTGRVLAMVGGYAYKEADFNRATQAKRQPGSAFKPFVYLTAMENGFTPTSIVVDGPIELSQGAGMPAWRPKNYSGDYLGPITLRRGLELSRNTITVRLGLMLGIRRIVEVTKRFGINMAPSPNFSTVLGATETTLLDLANAYGIIINGGKRIYPTLIERVQDRNGKTLYKNDRRECDGCAVLSNEAQVPVLQDVREQVTDPVSAYQVTSILQGVTQRGTAAKANSLGRSIAGKTGTTNNSYDTWFMGATPDLIIGTYVGFDTPKTLGGRETGASAALPVFIEFVKEALTDIPDVPFRIPPGVKLTKIDLRTGQAPTAESDPRKVIYEAFRTEALSSENAPLLQTSPGEAGSGTSGATPSAFGTGEIY